MESVAFEEFGIKGCMFDDCDQQFNQDSIKVAVWLYGVVFLHEEKRYECADSIFGERSEHEKIIMDKQTEGFIGITCPKCLRTNLYKKRIQEIKEFKTFLNLWSLPNKNDPDHKRLLSSQMSELIPVNLRYYSPFRETNDVLNDFCIHSYAYDEPIDTLNFSDDFAMTISGENKDLQNSFSTYDISDKSEPVGTHISIYWFPKENIAEITKHENENGGRLFPRYHYFHDLMEKIDSLLKYNYFAGEQIDQMLADAENSMKTDLRNYELHYHRKERIEGQKRQNEIDFESPKNFFDILISDPVELKPFMGETLTNCDYLWIKKNPFSGKGLPLDFSFGKQPDGYTEIAAELKSAHEKMVDLVQENYHKQYVQESLKDNLVDFLEQYEELIRFNTFSYASIWELKESYLEGLYKVVRKGLRNEVQYAMYREGDGWKITYDGKSFGGLRGKGFLWIYLTFLHQPSQVYYTSLHDTYEANPEEGTGDQVTFADNSDEEPKRRGYTDFEQQAYEEKTTDYMKNTEQVRITRSGILTKQFYADPITLKVLQEELEEKELAIDHAKLSRDIELFEAKMDDLIKFMEFLEKKYGIRKVKVKAKPGERDYKLISAKFKDERYRKINGRIKKNYRDALSKLKGVKDAKDLHAHLSKHFRSEDGAFIYSPPEDIIWHLD